MSVLDTSIVAEVRETLGDEMYRDFVVRMLGEAAEVEARLKTLMAEGNVPDVASVAHRMAGSAVSVGAASLHAHLKAIEDAARLDAGQGLGAMIDTLPEQIERTRAAMDDILG